MEEDYDEDAAVFVYNTNRVALVVLFEQIIDFILHPREGVDAPLITSIDKIPPNIRGLKTYFTLRNPCWIDQHAEGVNRRREGIKPEAPTPSKRNSGQKINDDASFAFNGTPYPVCYNS